MTNLHVLVIYFEIAVIVTNFMQSQTYLEKCFCLIRKFSSSVHI